MVMRNLRRLFWIVGVFAVTFGLLQFAGFAPSAEAAPMVGGPTPNALGGTSYCLDVSIYSLTALDTNTTKVRGGVLNNCGWTVTNLTIDIYGYVQCSTGNKTLDPEDGISGGSVGYNSVEGFTGELVGRCVVCTNGVATSWPPFTQVVQVDASGFGPSSTTVKDTGTAEGSIRLPNGNPAYSIPC